MSTNLRKIYSLDFWIKLSLKTKFYYKLDQSIAQNKGNLFCWTGVNFTKILRADFAPIFLERKSTNLKCKYKVAVHKTCAWKSCAQNVGDMDSRKKQKTENKF